MTPVRFYNDTQPENPSAGSFLPRLCLEGTRLFLQAVKACLGLCGNFKKWWNYRRHIPANAQARKIAATPATPLHFLSFSREVIWIQLLTPINQFQKNRWLCRYNTRCILIFAFQANILNRCVENIGGIGIEVLFYDTLRPISDDLKPGYDDLSVISDDLNSVPDDLSLARDDL